MSKSLVLVTTSFLATTAFAQSEKPFSSINTEAPVTCSKSIIINAERDKVWAVLTTINSWHEWQTDISNPILKGELKPQSTFKWKTGGAKITSTLHTVEPNTALGWTGKTAGIMAIHNWILTEKDGKTTVQVEESMEGFLARLFKKTLSKKLETGLQTWLHLLKVECEKVDTASGN